MNAKQARENIEKAELMQKQMQKEREAEEEKWKVKHFDIGKSHASTFYKDIQGKIEEVSKMKGDKYKFTTTKSDETYAKSYLSGLREGLVALLEEDGFTTDSKIKGFWPDVYEHGEWVGSEYACHELEINIEW